MTPLVRLALGLALVAVAGCAQPSASPPANLAGSHDAVLVADLLLVTSTERNELRALDLSKQSPPWVAAPNPLEPLSIPVLDRPVSLARDVRYEGDLEIGGPYVYAMSSGTAAISVVHGVRSQASCADPCTELVEVARITTPGPVTAISGRGPGAPGETSTLYYASADPGASNVWQVALTTAAQLLANANATQPAKSLVASFPTETVSALLTMPDGQLAIATRGQAGTAGRVLLVDAKTLATRTLSFPGTVRALFTHSAVPDNGLAAGARIFGFLDEESCGTGPECSGLVAVDSATGSRALDAAGAPMLTIAPNIGLLRGLAFGRNVEIAALKGTDGPDQPFIRPLVGVLTTANGQVHLFDGANLNLLDADLAKPEHTVPVYRGPPTADSEGASLTYVEGPVNASIALADGAARDETVTVEFQAAIPGLAGLPTSPADGQQFKVPAQVLGRAAVGDLVGLFTASGDCGASLPVTSITTDALVVSDAIPAPCADRTAFWVYAGGAKPYVVTGAASGYMGRTGPNDDFAFNGTYFQHPPGTDLAIPQLAFHFGPGDPSPVKGNHYLFQTASRFAPLATSIGESNSQRCTATLPGSVVWAAPEVTTSEGGRALRPRAFLAYPSAHGVLELTLEAIGTPANGNPFCYR